MLRLSTTTDKIQVILGGAITTNQLDCVATYKDINVSAAYTASAPSLVATNGTTAVDLVDSPASDTQRFVDFISVFNTDTANATVTIRLNRNGTLGVLFRCVLGVGELVTYTEGQGWVVYQNNGSIKNAATVTDGSITPAKLSQPYTQAASVTLSGVSYDFTGIPSWVTEIHLKFAALSTNGSSIPILQLGDAGGIETSGYLGSVSTITSAPATNVAAISSGLALSTAVTASSSLNGTIIISMIDSATNRWICTFIGSFSSGAITIHSSADKSLSQTLDRIRLTTFGGTDSFDAGLASISYW